MSDLKRVETDEDSDYIDKKFLELFNAITENSLHILSKCEKIKALLLYKNMQEQSFDIKIFNCNYKKLKEILTNEEKNAIKKLKDFSDDYIQQIEDHFEEISFTGKFTTFDHLDDTILTPVLD